MTAPASTVTALPTLIVTTLELEDVGEGLFKFTAKSLLGSKVSFLGDVTAGEADEDGVETFLARDMGAEKFHTILDDDTGIEDIIFNCHGYRTDPPGIMRKYQAMVSQVPATTAVVPVIWPTDELQWGLGGYRKDQESSQKSAELLGREFATFTEKYAPTPTRLNIVCHSMGNRLLRFMAQNIRQDLVGTGQAATETEAAVKSENLVDNIIMVAADVPFDIFDDATNPEPVSEGRAISTLCKHLAVFYADDDRALDASRLFNGVKRLGAVGALVDKLSPAVTNLVNFNSSSWNNKTDSGLGHSYVVAEDTMKILNVLLQGKVPTELAASPKSSEGGCVVS